jgi:hypothetical protein
MAYEDFRKKEAGFLEWSFVVEVAGICWRSDVGIGFRRGLGFIGAAVVVALVSLVLVWWNRVALGNNVDSMIRHVFELPADVKNK